MATTLPSQKECVTCSLDSPKLKRPSLHLIFDLHEISFQPVEKAYLREDFIHQSPPKSLKITCTVDTVALNVQYIIQHTLNLACYCWKASAANSVLCLTRTRKHTKQFMFKAVCGVCSFCLLEIASHLDVNH